MGSKEKHLPNWIYISFGVLMIIALIYFLIGTIDSYSGSNLVLLKKYLVSSLLWIFIPAVSLIFVAILLFLFGFGKLKKNKLSDTAVRLLIIFIVIYVSFLSIGRLLYSPLLEIIFYLSFYLFYTAIILLIIGFVKRKK